MEKKKIQKQFFIGTKSRNDTEVSTQQDVEIWKGIHLKLECFDSFRKSQQIMKITMCSENDKVTSRSTLKQQVCKHSLGLLVIK